VSAAAHCTLRLPLLPSLPPRLLTMADPSLGIDVALAPSKASKGYDGDGRVMMFSFFEELAEPIKKVALTAWSARGKLAHDVKTYTVLAFSMVYSMPGRAIKVVRNPKLYEAVAEEEDPEALAAVVFGAGGALCLGSVGAVVGATLGVATGTVVGVVPVLFTFGLSLPIGAVVGGLAGLGCGTAVAGSAGFVGGATSGTGVAYFRGEIRQCVVYTGAKLYDVYDLLVARPVGAITSTTKTVYIKVNDSADYTKEKASKFGEVVKEVASDKRVQVAAVGAGTGAAAVGTAGAATGAVVGGATGALVGLVPALFTFGLSIPVGAVLGGGTGLCVGGAAGTSIGFAGGGTLGALGYTYRDAPAGILRRAKAVAREAAIMAGAKVEKVEKKND